MYAEVQEPSLGGDGSGGERWNRVLRIEREWRSAAPQPALELRMAIGDPGDLKMKAECREYSMDGVLEKLVEEAGEDGILLTELAEKLGADKRSVQKRLVGSGNFRMEGGKRGRGHSWRVFAAGVGGDDEES